MTFLKRYFYNFVAAELGAIGEYFGKVFLFRDGRKSTEFLQKLIEPICQSVDGLGAEELELSFETSGKRNLFVFNGDLNRVDDPHEFLSKVKRILRSEDRAAFVVYSPFYRYFYQLAAAIGLLENKGPRVFLTSQVLAGLLELNNLELVRRRYIVLVPIYIPILSNLLNRIVVPLPVFRNFSWVNLMIVKKVQTLDYEELGKVSVIVPARNEAGNIRRVARDLRAVSEWKTELVYVEGNSSDDTWKVIEEVTNENNDNQNPNFEVIGFQQPGKGKYDAVKHGFGKATGDVFVILDADLTVPADRLPRFVETYCRGGGCFVNGSRLVLPMEKEAMRFLNWIANVLFAKTLAHLLGLPISDSLCGTKVISRQNWEWLEKWRERFGDHDPFGDFDLLYASSELGMGLKEVPVSYKARTYGETQIQRFRDGLTLLKMAFFAFIKIYLPKAR